MKKVICLLLAGLATPAQAEDIGAIRVNISVGSVHSEAYRVRYRTEEYQSPYFPEGPPLEREVSYKEYFDESNPGIGLEVPLSERSYGILGLFDNSYPGNTLSIYGGFGLDIIQTRHFALCGEGVFASGYGENYIGGDICARIAFTDVNRIKIHYAPGETFGMGTDVYAFEYQFAFY